MKYQAFVRAAATVLSTALIGTAALAQSAQPRTDTAPPPADDRSSLGAVIMMDEPVLAQRAQMQTLMANTPDTRTMGAGPTRLLRDLLAEDKDKPQDKPKAGETGTPAPAR